MKRYILCSFLIFYLSIGLNAQILDSPILTEPPDVDVVVPLTVELQWDAVPGAQSYDVQISSNSSFTGPITINSVNVPGTSYDIPAGMLNTFTIYYWRVRALNLYEVSEFSDTWSFRTAGTPGQEIPSLESVVYSYLQNHINQANILNRKLELSLRQFNMSHMRQAILHMQHFKLRVIILTFSNYLTNTQGERLVYIADKIIGLYSDDSPSAEIDLYPKEYSLQQNYPNPFNPTTTIEYKIPKDGYVSLKVYDIKGKEITSLVDKYQSTGSYIVMWDASNFSSGVYFYRIIAGDYSATKRMVLKK
jgi:hypothetical protein